MNGLEIIYLIGAAAVGVLAGMIIELSIDAQTIRDLQDHNRKLRLENEQLKKNQNIEHIEIVDSTVADGVDFSKGW